MASIIIKNIGPIKEASFDLNKINVFMGPQSSGKSTIAKIISYCTWVEKDVATSQSLKVYEENKDYFKERLEFFHKIKGYFNSDTYISYKSNIIEMKYKNGEFAISWVNQYDYKRSKISYIPAERNMISLPEVEKVEFGNVNVRSFLFDWLDARKKYPKEHKLSILNLGVNYYYADNGLIKEDHIYGMSGNQEYDIFLSNASSGLQSITPLVAMIDYLTNWVYREDKTSFELDERSKQTQNILIDELILKKYFEEGFDASKRKEKIDEINKKITIRDTQVLNLYRSWKRIIRQMLFATQNSQFIIEEPEQNLFPETQRDLVYHLLEKCLHKDANRLTITTHSPYVLYALNNCMMGKLVFDKMDEADKNSIACKSALISPKDVSIYQIDTGILNPIQQADGLIGNNYFDEKMKDIMDDFYTLLKYYGDEE
jgi:predicted ATPase